jgi:hypothetical protein
MEKIAHRNTYQVFIFCSGKSGSTSLYNSFIKAGYETIHCHNPHQFRKVQGANSICIFDLIENSRKHFDKIYIIDAYRNPIERKLASFFNNLNIHMVDSKYSLDNIQRVFNREHIFYIEEYHSINIALRFYNQHLFNRFVFDEGFNIMNYENISFIKLRFKDIDIWENVLSNICNNRIQLMNSNLSKEKTYNTLYTEAKNQIKIDKLYLKRLRSDREFLIYNTTSEIEYYYDYWSERSMD